MASPENGRQPHPSHESEAPDAYSGPERRQAPCDEAGVEPVILTRKLADNLNGIELADCEVGDRLCLATNQAALIVAEGWARPAEARKRRRG